MQNVNIPGRAGGSLCWWHRNEYMKINSWETYRFGRGVVTVADVSVAFSSWLHLKCSMNGPLSKMLNVKILNGWCSGAALLNPTFICSGLIQEHPCGTKVAAGYVKAGFGPYFEKATSCCFFAVSHKTCCFASGKWTTKYFRGCPCRCEPVLLFGMYLWQKSELPEQKKKKKKIKGTGIAPTSKGCVWQGWMHVPVLCPAVTALTLQQLRVLSQREIGFILALLKQTCRRKDGNTGVFLCSVTSEGKCQLFISSFGSLWVWHLIDGLCEHCLGFPCSSNLAVVFA